MRQELLAVAARLDNLMARRPPPSKDPTIRTFTWEGGTIRYRHAGAGPLVVMAADPPNVVEHYDTTIACVTERAMSSLVIELPGFGMSRGMAESFETAADAVAALLEYVSAGPATIAFGCVSAYVGNLLARKHPHLVAAVVVMQAPSWSEELRWIDRVDGTGLISKPILGQIAVRVRLKTIARDWYRVAAAERETAEWLAHVAVDAIERNAAFPLASMFQQALYRPAPELAPVDQPSTIIWGVKDRSHRGTDRLTSRTLAGSESEFVEWIDAGHFPELEQPDRFASLVATGRV